MCKTVNNSLFTIHYSLLTIITIWLDTRLKQDTHYSINKFILIIILTTLTGSMLPMDSLVLAQSPVTTKVDRDTIARNEQVTFTVTVSGDFLNIPNPNMSSLQDFVVVSSSVSTQVSIVNGEMSSQKVFIYRLQPLAEGVLTISPIEVIVGSRIHKTAPIEIEVLPDGTIITPPDTDSIPAESADTLIGQDFFVEAEISNQSPYLSEQLIYTFRIYQAIQFPPGQPDYQPPPFTDFWTSEIVEQPHYNTETAGRNYLVTEVNTVLFPANLGSLTIDPAGLVIPGGLLSPDIRLESKPITVDIRPLPENAPGNFSGAVGEFDIRASLSDVETKANEPVTLFIEIEGTGNVETLTEPELPDLANWRFFESQISTETHTDDGILSGIRTFERLVVPGRAGELEFPPIDFTYYNPHNEEYQTISTDPIPLTVIPDDSLPVSISIAAPDTDSGLSGEPVILDVQHIKAVPVSLSTTSGVSMGGWLFYISCWILPLFAVGLVYLFHSRQQRLKQDTAYARDQRAKRRAMKTLDNAKQSPTINEAGAAGKALLGYLADKLNTPVAGLTTTDLVKLLQSTQLSEDLVNRVNNLLLQIDVGRYAPLSAASDASISDETKQLINDLEKSLGKRR